MSDNDSPKIRINDQEYDLPEGVTLGEQREVKRVFGFRWADLFDELTNGDPDAWAGFLYVAMRRKRPGDPEAVILREIDSLNDDDLSAAVDALNAANEAEEDEGDRPPEAADAAGSASGDGSQATTREPAGSQRTRTSSGSAQKT